jgi:hypothetical protein
MSGWCRNIPGISSFAVFAGVLATNRNRKLRTRARYSSGHRVRGSEQPHQFWECGGETALSPFEIGLIGHGLAEHSDDQTRDKIDRFI